MAATCGEVSCGVLSGLGLQPSSLDPAQPNRTKRYRSQSERAAAPPLPHQAVDFFFVFSGTDRLISLTYFKIKFSVRSLFTKRTDE